jgi:hypothetical protein
MNTQQLEARSEMERQDIENTVGELKRRLSPGQLVDEMLAYTNDGGGQFLSNLGRQMTNNPLPVTLIGAGLVWFLFSKDGSARNMSSSRASGNQRSSGTSSTSFSGSGIDEAGSDALHAAGDKAQSMAATVSESLDSVSQTVSSTAESAVDGVSRGASTVAGSAAAAGRNVRGLAVGASDFLKNQPLVLLGAGLALGAALGAGLPQTQTEDERMGQASENLKEQIRNVAAQHLDKATEAGHDLYQHVVDDVREVAENYGSATPGPQRSDGNGDGQQSDEGQSSGRAATSSR